MNPEKEGSLIYQLIYERKVCRITSKYKIFNHEWGETTGQILSSSSDSSRASQLSMIRFNVDRELHQLCKIVNTLALSGREWTFSDLTSHFNSFIDKDSSVFHFIQMQIQRKKQLGKVRSSETYQATLNSFMSFRCGIDLTFDMIDSELMELYEAELQNRGLTRNTSSFYLRIFAYQLQTGRRKGTDPRLSSIQAGVLRYRQDGKAKFVFCENQADKRAGFIPKSGFGFCPRHVPV